MRVLDKREWLQSKDATGGLVKSVTVAVKKSTKSADALRFTVSDSGVDRDGDTISALGWELENYEKNPVILWGHDSSMPPVGRSLRTLVKDGALASVAEPVPEDVQDPRGMGFGASMFRLYRDGFLKAVSVGFLPREWKEAEGRGAFSVDFTKQELLEYSLVPVPSNPRALIDANKSHGDDVRMVRLWAERVLDEHGADETEAKAVEKATDEKRTVISIPSAEIIAELTQERDDARAKLAAHESAQAAILAQATALEERSARVLIRAALREQLQARSGKEK